MTDRPDIEGDLAHTPAVGLPPLLAVTTVEVKIYLGSPSARLVDILSSIHSAPALSSITFKYLKSSTVEDTPTSSIWVDIDKWLARLAMNVKTGRSLTAILMPRPEGNSKWEECLPKFTRAGGELRVETNVHS